MEFLCIVLLLSTTIVLALPVPIAFSISSHADNRLSHISSIWRNDDHRLGSNETPQQAPFSDTAATSKEPEPSLGSSFTHVSGKEKRYLVIERPISSLTATSSPLQDGPHANRDGREGVDAAAVVAFG